MTKTAKITSLKRDPMVYPRFRVDSSTVGRYTEAMDAGAEFPPIIVDQDMRVMDGIHRLEAYARRQVETVKVEVVRTKNDRDFFMRALSMNSAHGHQYTQIDYAHMILRGRELGIDPLVIAELVHVTPGYLEEATKGWFAQDGQGGLVPIKRTISHMAGQKLTADQIEANRKLGGWGASFYVNQINILLTNDLVNEEHEKTIMALSDLYENLRTFFIGHDRKYPKHAKARAAR